MTKPASDHEKVIALAFLRSGRPWFAFGVVLIASTPRILMSVFAIISLVVMGPGAASVAGNAIAKGSAVTAALR
jgi:hypothetical protein